MCLIAAAWGAHPRFPLALIANRDELHDRPSTPAGPDPDRPDIHGGRDLLQGGSWLLASSGRRLAAVTNVRDGPAAQSAPRSRGVLVHDFVADSGPADDWFKKLSAQAGDYGRFNMLGWDGDALMVATNHPAFDSAPVSRGIHAMSNGAFDAPWPKSAHAVHALTAWLNATPADVAPGPEELEPLLDALADTTPAPDEQLPDTGVGLALERLLSPAFVSGPHYGTRCSTVVLVEDKAIRFFERRFGPDGVRLEDTFDVIPTTD